MDELVNQLYGSFDTGYDFEIFLKEFLNDMNFNDIVVTKKSCDNGIDLECYKSSIEELDKKPEKYIVQAKRVKGKVPVSQIREFKGTSGFEKRIFITTGSFTDKGIEEAENDPSRYIILISGKDIIEFYLKNKAEKIFDCVYIYSKEKIEKIIKKNSLYNISLKKDLHEIKSEKILKIISRNDIRARILPIPNEIYKKIKNEEYYDLSIDNKIEKLKINSSRRYFSGVTKYYKEHDCYARDLEKINTYWYLDEENKKIYVELI